MHDPCILSLPVFHFLFKTSNIKGLDGYNVACTSNDN